MPLICELRFERFKTLRSQTIPLEGMNILTGVNNAGKSTALSGLRLLDAALRFAGHRSPDLLQTPQGRRLAYAVPTRDLSTSVENVHTDLDDVDTTVTAVLADGALLTLWFPPDGGLIFYVDGVTPPKTRGAFRSRFPFEIIQVPVLGPLEHDEPLVLEETVRGGLATHRAARHFRNYWNNNEGHFDAFASLVAETWPGVQIGRPERTLGPKGGVLHMYCEEARAPRELFWCGFGFQVWCQLLTHISRAHPESVLVVDEPETYLHPTVQRSLLQVLKRTGAQVVVATHAATLIACAAPGEVVEISKHAARARRYTSHGTQLCVDLGLLPLLGTGISTPPSPPASSSDAAPPRPSAVPAAVPAPARAGVTEATRSAGSAKAARRRAPARARADSGPAASPPSPPSQPPAPLPPKAPPVAPKPCAFCGTPPGGEHRPGCLRGWQR